MAAAAEKQGRGKTDDWKELIELGLQLEKTIDDDDDALVDDDDAIVDDDDNAFVDDDDMTVDDDDDALVNDDNVIFDDRDKWCNDILLNKTKFWKFNRQFYGFSFVLLYIVTRYSLHKCLSQWKN